MAQVVGGEARDNVSAWQVGLTGPGTCRKGCTGHDSGAHTTHNLESIIHIYIHIYIPGVSLMVRMVDWDLGS